MAKYSPVKWGHSFLLRQGLPIKNITIPTKSRGKEAYVH